jgi:hypothetical protein
MLVNELGPLKFLQRENENSLRQKAFPTQSTDFDRSNVQRIRWHLTALPENRRALKLMRKCDDRSIPL